MVELPLALTGDQWIALVGILVGLAGTVGGFLFAYFNGRAERDAAKTLAQSGRLHSQRLDAYAELSAFLVREGVTIQRAEALLRAGDDPGPPEAISEDEWIKLIGRISVAGSEAVKAAVTEVQQAVFKFITATMTYRGVLNQNASAIQLAQTREQLDAARDPALSAIENAQRVMRNELANL